MSSVIAWTFSELLSQAFTTSPTVCCTITLPTLPAGSFKIKFYAIVSPIRWHAKIELTKWSLLRKECVGSDYADCEFDNISKICTTYGTRIVKNFILIMGIDDLSWSCWQAGGGRFQYRFQEGLNSGIRANKLVIGDCHTSRVVKTKTERSFELGSGINDRATHQISHLVFFRSRVLIQESSQLFSKSFSRLKNFSWVFFAYFTSSKAYLNLWMSILARVRRATLGDSYLLAFSHQQLVQLVSFRWSPCLCSNPPQHHREGKWTCREG